MFILNLCFECSHRNVHFFLPKIVCQSVYKNVTFFVSRGLVTGLATGLAAPKALLAFWTLCLFGFMTGFSFAILKPKRGCSACRLQVLETGCKPVLFIIAAPLWCCNCYGSLTSSSYCKDLSCLIVDEVYVNVFAWRERRHQPCTWSWVAWYHFKFYLDIQYWKTNIFLIWTQNLISY